VSPDSLESIIKRDPPAPLLRRIASYRQLHLCALAVLVLDQLSKWVVELTIPFGTWGGPDAITVIPGFFHITHVGNTGAAWSMLSGRSVLLASIAALTLVAIYVWRHSLGLRNKLTQVGFGLLIGGIIGNLIDRLTRHYVVDFLDFHFGSYVYPTFNIADSGICVGVAIYMWMTLREERK